MAHLMGAWRSFGRNASEKQKVRRGTAKRTLLFAVPYGGLLAMFFLS